jgi:hypothetical protein
MHTSPYTDRLWADRIDFRFYGVVLFYAVVLVDWKRQENAMRAFYRNGFRCEDLAFWLYSMRQREVVVT